MSFVGVIDSEKNKVIWSKAILSLAAISDHIKFIVSSDSLSISAVNNARTSHAEVVFKRSFFFEYSVNFTNITPEGFDNGLEENTDGVLDGSNLSYSFVINSKHLGILFKNIDAVDIDYICFKIHWSRLAPVKMMYKLLIEIKTKKLIIKKYQTNFQPVLKNKLDVSTIYKRQLYDQEHRSEKEKDGEIDKVNYIMIEQIIPKQFLDMILASTEDFKIEIKNEKILFSGYTRQIQKDREYLKQQMSVSIGLTLDELLNTNLTADSDEPHQKSINFRLRDFRNFMNLITSISLALNSESNIDDYLNLNNMVSMSNEDYFEIFFKNPGDPILFELQSNPHILIQYVQITNDDEFNIPDKTKIDMSGRKHSKILHPHVVDKIRLKREENFPGESKTSIKRKMQKPVDQLGKRVIESHDHNGDSLFVPELESQDQAFSYSSNNENENLVTYGERLTSTEAKIKRQKNESNGMGIFDINVDNISSVIDVKENDPKKRIIINEDTDYGSDDNEGSVLGPTQAANRPKSIFD